jgi:tetratricopeptide (TPR) repeat protein
VRKLTEHAIARITKAVENIDDSDGHCMSLFNRAQEIHLAACRAAPPDPVALARDFFSREMEDDYEIFHRAAPLYADVLGEDGLTEYRRLAIAGWEKLPPRTGDGRVHHEYFSDYGQLASILDFFAERDDDVAARIALRAKDLSSPWNYLQLAEFCLSQDRKDEALRYAEEGLWVFEDARQDERLVYLVADLMLGAGRKKDAKALLRRAFEREPSLEIYRRRRQLGDKDAVEPSVAFLRTRIAKDSSTPWHSPTDLLIRVLMEEKMFDAAWAAVQDHGASGGLKESLAGASEATHPRMRLMLPTSRPVSGASATS